MFSNKLNTYRIDPIAVWSKCKFRYCAILLPDKELSCLRRVKHRCAPRWHILTNTWPVLPRIALKPYPYCPKKIDCKLKRNYYDENKAMMMFRKPKLQSLIGV